MDRQKLVNVRNFIKSENGRLSSLALPRDLSLGGSKQKKVYTPNLNVVRNKNKPKEIIQKLAQQRIKKEKNYRNQRQDSSRYIQSGGLFSEGAFAEKRPTQQNVDRHCFSKEQDPVALMTIPKFEKNEWMIDTEEEQNVINTLLSNDNCSSDSEGEYAPTILPLKNNKNGFATNFKVKKEKVKVKIEPGENPIEKKADFKIKLEDFADGPSDNICFTATRKYDDDNLSVSLLKMPDTFPGKGFTEDSDQLVDYTLNHMHEGQIGKILVRKSGKIEVYIGDIPYLIDAEENPEFFEQIMVLPEETSKSSSPSVGVMGAIDERYILSPSWKNLFVNTAKKKCKKK